MRTASSSVRSSSRRRRQLRRGKRVRFRLLKSLTLPAAAAQESLLQERALKRDMRRFSNGVYALGPAFNVPPLNVPPSCT